MPSPPPPSEGSSASLPSTDPSSNLPIAGPSRTILSFFGGSSQPPAASGSTTPANGGSTTAAKKRRKKDDNQPKLSLNGSENGMNWVMGKPEPEPGPEVRKSNGTKNSQGGEEEELRDMAQKIRGKGKGRGKRKSDVHDAPGNDEDLIDLSLLPHPSTSQEQSPPKKKGRPRKSQAAAPVNSSSIDYPSAPPSSVFTGPASSSRRPSTDYEVTGQTRSIKGTGSHDAIEIDQNSSPDRPIPISSTSPIKVGPKKIAFAADKKPQHSFFSRLTANTPIGTDTNGSGSGNRSRASSINSVNTALSGEDTGPTARKEKEKEKKKGVHGFFKNVSLASEGVLKNGWGNGIKDGEELVAPLPRGEWPNHFTPPHPGNIVLKYNSEAGPSRRTRPMVKEALDDGFWYSVLANSTSAPDLGMSQNSEIFSIPTFMLQHPAFTSIPSKSTSSTTSNRDSWSDRYRPLRASEVLSNEIEAGYLKDWLSALSIGSSHRKVVRKVKRALKSNLVDGWIVDDLALFGTPQEQEEEEEEEIELEELDDPSISPDPHDRPDTYPNLNDRLTNTILLTGPHGSGKSAAVYAAAHELGWDVFEVFPGMGKRTAANLMSWVGDVGKNHMVAQDKKTPPKKEKGGLKSFFGKAKVELGGQGSAHEPIDIDLDEDNQDQDGIDEIQVLGSVNGNGDGNGNDGKIRQSLILIDEADILFDEESTFWPAVVSIISESRRPVVLTCNDHNLIPKAQLPLQAILQFRPPPSYIALSYLQTIADQESRMHKRPIPDVLRIYEESIHQRGDALDIPLPPNGNERIQYFDLRKAVGQLQLDRSAPSVFHNTPNVTQIEQTEDDLAALFRRLEFTSYVDAHVGQKEWMQLEVTEVDRHYPTTDDQLGIHALVKPEIDESYPVLAGYDYCSSFSKTLLNLGGGRVDEIGNLSLDRMKYIRSTLPILDPLIPLSAPLLPHPSLFLYTLPTILNIVEVDDILQSAEEEAVSRGEERINRKTGRPVRGGGGYTRWLADLDEYAEGVARGLRWS
ncbi:hypothetical protein I302_105791 [Kwoniella bestiolae CBS 10118]|uniref:AAA+ ATPase domain-containing protein n=1 Tax=Kwoniella bestiolae CBS 10118 TaxID=1296100 RepID=A0A1B9G244_9TREE|nr:hypothetical protein I302_04912 [Kwoniella bestiolae CBS 10118]OCF25102.1 hypothetical protein I302_04912 [Kwoniella bestiolae CBS 10118]